MDSRGAAEWVRNKFNHNIKFYHNIKFTTISTLKVRQRRCCFQGLTKVVTQRKSKRCLWLSRSLIGLFPKNECLWLAITTSKNYHKNSELSETTAMLDVYSWTYNLNCSVTAKNSSRIIDFAAKHTHWHSQWCSHGKSQPKQWSLRQSMKSNLKLAPLEHEQTTAELASLLTRALERMVEQFFNCFTDGLEL